MAVEYGHPEKHSRILETAYQLFKQGGFNATGVDRIIAESGVAKMTVYRHFTSKDELIVAVLKWRMDRFDRQLDRIEQSSETPDRKIAEIFDWYERWFQTAGFNGCLFAHALAEFSNASHPVFAIAVEQKLALKRRLESILASTLPPDRADTVATAMVMLIEGATLLAQAGQGPAAAKAARTASLNLLNSATAPQ